MANILKILRSVTAGNRPSGHVYGEIYANLADGQFGIINSSNVAQDLIGVRLFSTGCGYTAGNVVSYLGQLYMANTTITAGAWNAGQWTAFQPIIAGTVIPNTTFNCGRLVYASPTALSFRPFNGNLLKINGSIYQIPATGIAGLGVTGVYVGGVAGQNLVGNTTYYVFAFNNGGTLTGDFWAQSAASHAPSAVTGNLGIETKWNVGLTTEDATRTLIGMVQVWGTHVFVDDGQDTIGVASWYNRRFRTFAGQSTGTIAGITSTTYVQYGTWTFFLLNWADSWPTILMNALVSNDTAGQYTVVNAILDSNTANVMINPQPRAAGATSAPVVSLSGWGTGFALSGPFGLAEGFHSYSPGAFVTGGTGTANMVIGASAFL